MLTAIGLVLAGCGGAAVDSAAGSPEEPGLSAARLAVQPAPELRCSGTTLTVPGRYATIGAALAAAKAGDRVSVGPGTYPECITLVDGVTLEGRNATIDATGCSLAAILGEATIVRGATVRGFTIVNAPRSGISLVGSANVRIENFRVVNPGLSAVRTDGATALSLENLRAEGAGQQGIFLYGKSTAWASRLDVSGSGYAGVVVWDSRLVLLRSTFSGNGGNGSVRVSTGSSAYLEGNRISGKTSGVAVDNGLLEEGDPAAAPAEAWLVGNDIHDLVGYGAWVYGKGSELHGRGNRYQRVGAAGVYVTLASYDGRGELLAGNGEGLLVSGWDYFCLDAACTDVKMVNGSAQASLRESRIRDSQWSGVRVDAGGTARLEEVSVLGSGASGPAAAALVTTRGVFEYGGLTHVTTGPALLQARESAFVKSSGPGVLALEDARLDLGSGHEGGENSFLQNAGGSISNQTPNPVPAERNWFGTRNAAEIQASIQDCTTNTAWGCVDFTPFLTHPE